MIHPRELIRSDSKQQRDFSAPIIKEIPLDCGLSNLPCLNRCFNLEKFAKPSVFIGFLSVVAFLQGVALEYFRATSKHWSKHYNISQDNAEWIVYTNEVFVGVFALCVAYWGNRIHRISWIGCLTIYHSISSLMLIIPEVYKDENAYIPYADNLCKVPDIKNNETLELDYIALFLLAVFQVIFSMTYISFITHGISYLDDNAGCQYSPIYIGIALAAKELGTQMGIYMAMIPDLIEIKNIFISPAWMTIEIAAFCAGVLITMFPRTLPRVLVKRRAASLVNFAVGRDENFGISPTTVDSFLTAIWTLLKNKFLIINISVTVILQSAWINFNIFEKQYNQSRFFISEEDTSFIQTAMRIIKQPLIAIVLVATGLIIAKAKISVKSLVKWNMIASVFVIILFASTAFLKCEHSSLSYKNSVQMWSTIANNCHCLREFQPICIESKTHYSPCMGECTRKTKNNDKYVCNQKEGTEGACMSKNCVLFWALSQANRIFSSAFLTSTTLTNLIINMRCINPKNKAVALGLQATFLGLIPYLPVKLAYDSIAKTMCEERSDKDCYTYKESFGLFISLCTIGLILLSILLSIVLLCINVPSYNDNETDEEEMVYMGVGEPGASLMPRNEQDNFEREEVSPVTQSNPDSLADLENVGDDHDSISASPTPPKNRLLESSF